MANIRIREINYRFIGDNFWAKIKPEDNLDVEHSRVNNDLLVYNWRTDEVMSSTLKDFLFYLSCFSFYRCPPPVPYG